MSIFTQSASDDEETEEEERQRHVRAPQHSGEPKAPAPPSPERELLHKRLVAATFFSWLGTSGIAIGFFACYEVYDYHRGHHQMRCSSGISTALAVASGVLCAASVALTVACWKTGAFDRGCCAMVTAYHCPYMLLCCWGRRPAGVASASVAGRGVESVVSTESARHREDLEVL